VAVKIVRKGQLRLEPKLYKKMEREIAVMKLLRHQHVLSLRDVYETSDYLFLISEYIEGGELFDYLYEHGALPLPLAKKLFSQLVEALDYCHSHLICHRDLKPESMYSFSFATCSLYFFCVM
jgi:serine/threonine protein kinase